MKTFFLLLLAFVLTCRGQSVDNRFTYTKNPNGTITLRPLNPCYEVALEEAPTPNGPWRETGHMWSAPGQLCGSFSYTVVPSQSGGVQKFWRLIIVR